MFFQRTEALPCADGDLVSLRMSLNAPVVATDVAAPSPARAAIAVQRGALPRLCVSVAVRPLDSTGGALVFRPDISSEESETLPTLIEAALSFGESMGFLFDDDELEGADREKRKRATARWNALLAGESFTESKPVIDVPVAAQAAPAPSFDSDATIDLEAATIELGEETALAQTAAPAPEPEPVAPAAAAPSLPSPLLTKFRRVAREPAAPAAAEAAAPTAEAPSSEVTPGADAGSRSRAPRGRAPLAKLQLVKRSRSGDPAPRASWLQRLLGSF